MDEMEGDHIKQQLDTLYASCISEAGSAGRKASIFKVLNIVLMLSITLSGAAISIVSTSNLSWKTPVLITLGLNISTIKILTAAFQPEYKAAMFKQLQIKLRRLARTVAMETDYNSENINSKLSGFYEQMDDLDIALFNEETSVGKMVTDMPGTGTRGIKVKPNKNTQEESPLLVSIN